MTKRQWRRYRGKIIAKFKHIQEMRSLRKISFSPDVMTGLTAKLLFEFWEDGASELKLYL